MIFTGDIAIPRDNYQHIVGVPAEVKKGAVANLEGCIIDYKPKKNSLYNSESVFDFFEEFNVLAVTMANNHVLDEHEAYSRTISKLRSHNVKYFGAGKNEEEARNYCCITEKNIKFYFLGYAWPLTGVHNKKKNKVHVSILDKKKVIDDIKRIKMTDENAYIVCFFHWGCELELYPYPADRKLAMEAIDAGASAIIGCHSHCIQGIEIYKNKPIVYGMGNFLVEEGVFLHGELSYPEIAYSELAFEIDNNNFRCHWFRYNPDDKTVYYVKTTDIDCKEVNDVTPFRGMDQREYCRWFKKNRRKNVLLPIFTGEENVICYSLKILWMVARTRAIRILFNLGIKGGPK